MMNVHNEIGYLIKNNLNIRIKNEMAYDIIIENSLFEGKIIK